MNAYKIPSNILCESVFSKHRILFCGFSGSGVATAMFSFLSYYQKETRSKICIENRDSYHIGKKEQLQMLCNIIGIQFYSEACNPSFQEQTDQNIHCIYVPGLKSVEDLESYQAIAKSEETDICLIVDCSRDTGINRRLLISAKELGISYLILTKIDLNENPSELIDYILSETFRVIMITKGENIPSDALVDFSH